MNKDEYQEYMKQLVDDGYINIDGKPLKCIDCESIDLHFNYYNHIQGNPCECEVICNTCNHVTGIWSYGTWEI